MKQRQLHEGQGTQDNKTIKTKISTQDKDTNTRHKRKTQTPNTRQRQQHKTQDKDTKHT